VNRSTKRQFLTSISESGLKFDGFYDRYDLMPRPLGPESVLYLQDFSKVGVIVCPGYDLD
jgi:hypothetical protein